LHDLTVNIFFIQSQEFFPVIEDNDVVIDALYGSGLNRPLKDLSAELVDHINRSEALVIAIDVPSGMFIDKSSLGNAVIKAGMTLTFQCLKMCFLLAENESYTGSVHVLDIGLLPAFPETVSSCFQLLGSSVIKKIYRPRNAFAHKGNFGHALLIAGSYGKIGAAVLAARACLRSGAGLLTVHIPGCGYQVIQTSVPEAMVQADAEDRILTSLIETNNFSAVGIGCGIGTAPKTIEALKHILSACKSPLILDADAINILGQDKKLLDILPENSVLTPHPKEFERITQKAKNDFHRHDLQREFAKKHHVIVVLKGAHTSIAFPDGRVYFNVTGNPGMAKGGSGDALTGIILSLQAQKYSPENASILGVYLHGLAGDIALKKQSVQSLLATDLVENLGEAFKKISLEIS